MTRMDAPMKLKHSVVVLDSAFARRAKGRYEMKYTGGKKNTWPSICCGRVSRDTGVPGVPGVLGREYGRDAAVVLSS
jgi:hypothetical protein